MEVAQIVITKTIGGQWKINIMSSKQVEMTSVGSEEYVQRRIADYMRDNQWEMKSLS